MRSPRSPPRHAPRSTSAGRSVIRPVPTSSPKYRAASTSISGSWRPTSLDRTSADLDPRRRAMSDKSPKSKQRDQIQKKIAKDKAAIDAKSKQDKQGLLQN